MGDSIVSWFVLAILLFWAMGAYNRLVRLRSHGIVAFAALERLFDQYLSMVKKEIPFLGSAEPHRHQQSSLWQVKCGWNWRNTIT